MVFDPEKLKAMKANNSTTKIGGTRVKVAATRVNTAAESQKVVSAVQRIGGRTIPKVEEVNLFHTNGEVTKYRKPKLVGAAQSNTWLVSGPAERKPLQAFMPGIFAHLGPENLDALRSLAGPNADAGVPDFDAVEEDAPDLVA